MCAFRRNKDAGGVSEEAERGCGPDPWNLCRSSYRREAAMSFPHMLFLHVGFCMGGNDKF